MSIIGCLFSLNLFFGAEGKGLEASQKYCRLMIKNVVKKVSLITKKYNFIKMHKYI